MTWSPAPHPHATIAICRAAVPELVVMAYRLPFQAANSCSNASQFGPNAWLAPSRDARTIRRTTSSMGGQFCTIPSGIALGPPSSASLCFMRFYSLHDLPADLHGRGDILDRWTQRYAVP